MSWAGRRGFANLSVNMHMGERVGKIEELSFVEPTSNALFDFTFGFTF